MGEFGWTQLAALLTAVGVGVVSALVPPVSAEVFVVASQVSTVVGAIPIAVCVAIGQTIGKLALFYGVRTGRRLQTSRQRPERVRKRPKSAFRLRFEAVVAKLLELIGQNRWGIPIVLLSGVVGIPPLYATALLAGATKMRGVWFALAVLAGRIIRFVLVAEGALNVRFWFV